MRRGSNIGKTGLLGLALGARYALGPGSAVLVRPDGRVAWRHDGACADRVAALAGAVATALGRPAAIRTAAVRTGAA